MIYPALCVMLGNGHPQRTRAAAGPFHADLHNQSYWKFVRLVYGDQYSFYFMQENLYKQGCR